MRTSMSVCLSMLLRTWVSTRDLSYRKVASLDLHTTQKCIAVKQ